MRFYLTQPNLSNLSGYQFFKRLSLFEITPAVAVQIILVSGEGGKREKKKNFLGVSMTWRRYAPLTSVTPSYRMVLQGGRVGGAEDREKKTRQGNEKMCDVATGIAGRGGNGDCIE